MISRRRGKPRGAISKWRDILNERTAVADKFFIDALIYKGELPAASHLVPANPGKSRIPGVLI